MYVIGARNAHAAMLAEVHLLANYGKCEAGMISFHEPLTVMHDWPKERVIFNGASPYRRLMHGLGVLAGQGDGQRMRAWFHVDQVETLIVRLRESPQSDDHVLQIWSCPQDVAEPGPTSLLVHFLVQDEKLNMIGFSRTPQDTTHFSMLHEYVASLSGIEMGRFWHVIGRMVMPEAAVNSLKPLADAVNHVNNPYLNKEIVAFPLISSPLEIWWDDLQVFMGSGSGVMGYRDPFFKHVAVPMHAMHEVATKMDEPPRYIKGLNMCENIRATDWRAACELWLTAAWNSWKQRTVVP